MRWLLGKTGGPQKILHECTLVPLRVRLSPAEAVPHFEATNDNWRSAIFIPFILLIAIIGACARSQAGVLPADVRSELNEYNVVWRSPSTNGSPGSMPIGNGDLTANIWVENGGDLMMYIGKSDAWSEGTRLLKIGRLRIHFLPNPFTHGASFTQTLDFYHGEIDITAGEQGMQNHVHIWVDANQPVIHIKASGDHAFTMTCSNEIWRSTPYTPTTTTDPPSGSWRGVGTNWTETADVVPSVPDRLVSYHRDATSLYRRILTGENLPGEWTSFPDPYLNRTFGMTIKGGTGFRKINNKMLQSMPETHAALSVYLYTAQTATAAEWLEQMNHLVKHVDQTDIRTALADHYKWWDTFWNRSWILVSGDAEATNVTRGYLEQRFLEACQGRGKYPIKFNGGTFTFDYGGENADYRRWGPGYWNQNSRLLYWPMLAAGDFDLMQPWFDCYTNMMPLQMAATRRYFGHDGAFFPETFNFFGLYELTDWRTGENGTNSGNQFIKYHYQGALEVLAMMLAYYDYTCDTAFVTNDIVPFGTQAIRFFDRHWPRVNGKIVFAPANALETYWDCEDPADYISGLRWNLLKLLELQRSLTTPELINEWSNCYSSLPRLPMDSTHSYVKPAKSYGKPRNGENPECYCIFPYRIYELGKSNLSVGLATFRHRGAQHQKNCWSQDVIDEPLLGLTGAAEADVVSNFNQTESQCRFQAFWASHNDYLPDLDNGGAAMVGLQFMLMQCNGKRIDLLPAWPIHWSVDSKLHALANTTVRLKLESGKVKRLNVYPASRAKNIVAPGPTGLTVDAEDGRTILRWDAALGASTYNVKRTRHKDGVYKTIATDLLTTHYTMTNPATKYYYVVSAVGPLGESQNSDCISNPLQHGKPRNERRR